MQSEVVELSEELVMAETYPEGLLGIYVLLEETLA